MKITLLTLLIAFMATSFDAEAKKRRFIKSKPAYSQTKTAPAATRTQTTTSPSQDQAAAPTAAQGSSTGDMVKSAVVGAAAGAATSAAINHFSGSSEAKAENAPEEGEVAVQETAQANSIDELIPTDSKSEDSSSLMMLILALGAGIIGFMFYKTQKENK